MNVIGVFVFLIIGIAILLRLDDLATTLKKLNEIVGFQCEACLSNAPAVWVDESVQYLCGECASKRIKEGGS